MAEIRQDLLSLNYSPNFDISGMQEADVNISLPLRSSKAPSPALLLTAVCPLRTPSSSSLTAPVIPTSTLTDEAGSFSFSSVPAGTYSLAAVLEGYVLSPSVGVSLTAGGTASVGLVCTPEPSLSLGAVAGTVSSAGLDGISPISGAKINMTNLSGAVVATTYSAADGEFVFYDVADGVYSLTATASGYLATAPVAVTILGGSIANVSLAMIVDGRTYSGTVSGIIRDASGAAVANCFVGLYAVKDVAGVQTETLVATARTNAEGKYLFGGVLAGAYMVKAKLEQFG